MKDKNELLAAWTTAGDAVLGAAVLTGLGAWAGFWLDDHLHTSPWLAVSLSLLGMSLGLARMVLKALKADSPSKAKGKNGKKNCH